MYLLLEYYDNTQLKRQTSEKLITEYSITGKKTMESKYKFPDHFNDYNLIKKTTWYTTGIKKSERYYSVNNYIKKTEEWDKNGELVYRIKNNKKINTTNEHSEEVMSLITSRMESYSGKFKSTYPNGQIEISCSYKEKRFHGNYVQYFENGQVEKLCNFIEGKYHGKYVEYFENGNIFEKKLYKNGKESDFHSYKKN